MAYKVTMIDLRIQHEEGREAGGEPVFAFNGRPSPGLVALASDLRDGLVSEGFRLDDCPEEPRLVCNFISRDAACAYRRNAKATFVMSIIELDEPPVDAISELYPYMIRALSNMLLAYVPGREAHFITLELGHYIEKEGPDFTERLISRIMPMAASVLVVDNRFEADLEQELWDGDNLTDSLGRAGGQLARWNLLPTPFPIAEILPPQDYRHLKRLYGIGGLSYGNLSARKDDRFWMSASGVDKSKLREVGRDILMVKDYDANENTMVISVPREVEPRRVSVDAIEHWMIYRAHPDVGAIIHVHAWMEGVPSTRFNYPCGTYQLAEAVAEQVGNASDPARAVVGLKNHGLTITGTCLEDIFERVEGKLQTQIPMS